MKAILALAAFLVLAGIAAAVNVETPINLTLDITDGTSYEELAGFNLIFGTPAFTAGWGNATATVTAPGELSKDMLAVGIVTVGEGTKALNFEQRRVKDPVAGINISVASISGIAEDNVSLATLNDDKFDSLAVAQGSALADAHGIHSAWTAAQFETNTNIALGNTELVEGAVDTATAHVAGGAAAIADHISLI